MTLSDTIAVAPEELGRGSDEQGLVHCITTSLPPFPETWDSTLLSGPSWNDNNLETLLMERNRDLHQAALDGWVLQTSVPLTSPIDGTVTILDTLYRLPARIEPPTEA